MKAIKIGKYLVVDPRVCHGQLTFKGTRVPVQTILNRLARGRTFEELRVSWPEVPPEAVAEAVQLATVALLNRWGVQAKRNHEPARSGRSA